MSRTSDLDLAVQGLVIQTLFRLACEAMDIADAELDDIMSDGTPEKDVDDIIAETWKQGCREVANSTYPDGRKDCGESLEVYRNKLFEILWTNGALWRKLNSK